MIEALGMVATNKATPPDRSLPFQAREFNQLIEYSGASEDDIRQALNS